MKLKSVDDFLSHAAQCTDLLCTGFSGLCIYVPVFICLPFLCPSVPVMSFNSCRALAAYSCAHTYTHSSLLHQSVNRFPLQLSCSQHKKKHWPVIRLVPTMSLSFCISIKAAILSLSPTSKLRPITPSCNCRQTKYKLRFQVSSPLEAKWILDISNDLQESVSVCPTAVCASLYV